ncbi:hypothetical protein [Paenibacillus sp. J2TS4]|uniref:hypothetical protein n=1 Tax=Paenibacillus sp. J2TS4 TaxID=2807194 RepID=UPI001B0F05A8|nr:hypothetical protein [Paenibacillus sp. J2TS4]GIP34300.1 hypothetical protein J2TS4_35100 [Paenibacillus sp. J2TS4]
MTQLPKRCLFCESNIAGLRLEGRKSYLFRNCYCTNNGEYEILEEVYERLHARPHSQKRVQYPYISGYIREKTDKREKIMLDSDNLSPILESSDIPKTLEEKMNKCLLFLYRHSSRPEDSVVLNSIHYSYNITYSPNLQEFIYILEELKTKKLITRIGAALQLTAKGWEHAASLSDKKPNKTCFIAVPADSSLFEPFRDVVVPHMDDNGFAAVIQQPAADSSPEAANPLEQIRQSDVVIADLTRSHPDVYFNAGFALGLGIPVIYTCGQEDTASSIASPGEPLVWKTVEELADKLVVALSETDRK